MGTLKNIILLGAPGSGKGTQSAMLQELGYSHVSTGNLLREEIAKESDLGLKVKEVMSSGNLVSDELVVELLKSNLDLENKSYIFDGFPRNLNQSKLLTEILEGYDSKAVFLNIDTEVLVERLTNRRMTKDGKHIYNLKTNPPKVEGVCDVTGESLIHRPDDREEVIRERMSVFHDEITGMLTLYRETENLVEIDASVEPKVVFDKIKACINE